MIAGVPLGPPRRVAVSVTPETSPGPLPPRPGQISEESRRSLARMARTLTLAVTSLASLGIGILIGYAARKRIHKWGHAG